MVSIQALSDSKILIARIEDFLRFSHSSPEWMKFNLMITRQLLLKKCEREHDLLTLSSSERYAKFITEHPEVDQLIQDYHLASFLGITPISLSRIRKQYRK